MRQVFLEKGILSIKEVCEPVLDDYSILVAVHYSFISSGAGLANVMNANHDLFFHNIPNKVKKIFELVNNHGLDHTKKIIKDKLYSRVTTLGHSCSGVVIAVGKKVQKFRVGDCVACVGAGVANHSDVVCVPENLAVHIKNKEFLKAASLTSIGAMALQSIRRANLQLGDTICVFGLETLGQLIIQLAKVSGCEIICIGSESEQIEYTKKIGFKYSFNSSDNNLEQSINFITNSKGVDCVILTPDYNSETALQEALKLVRKKGKIVIAENAGIKLKKNHNTQKEADILFSLSYGPGRFDPLYEYQGNDYPYCYVRWTENRNMELFVNLLENKQIEISDLIKNEFYLENVSEAIDIITEKKYLGIILNHNQNKKQDETIEIKEISNEIKFIPAFKDKIKVGFVGATKFTRLSLIPIISKLDNVIIDTIADRDAASSLNAAKYFPNANAIAAGSEFFYENDCNVVIVSSSSDIQTDEVINILQKGKAVFITKSLALNFDELDKLKNFFNKKKDVLFCVGYHKTFSPFIQKIKKNLSNRLSPLMIQYRINAGFIPNNQKMDNEWKPGRVIAQASHIFDIFCFLTESNPLAISVESIKQFNSNYFPTDNFIANISFEDGSICSLIFTSLGNEEANKERMEIFFDSKTIIMEDFNNLIGYGLSQNFNEKLRKRDDGYENLVNNFFEGIKKENKSLPIDLNRIITVSELTLNVDKLACMGGGELKMY